MEGSRRVPRQGYCANYQSRDRCKSTYPDVESELIVQISDDGDFEPMEVFRLRDSDKPNSSGQSSLATIPEVDMEEDEDEDADGEDEMMEFIQTQQSITSIVSYH